MEHSKDMIAAMACLETAKALTASDDMTHDVAVSAIDALSSDTQIRHIMTDISDYLGAVMLLGGMSRSTQELSKAVVHLANELENRAIAITGE